MSDIRSKRWCGDVVAGKTSVCRMKDGSQLLYRNIAVQDLLEEDFEDVAFLLLHGTTPQDDASAFEKFLNVMRKDAYVSPDIEDILEKVRSRDVPPMDTLRTLVSLLPHCYDELLSSDDESKAAILLAKMSTLVGYVRRLRIGEGINAESHPSTDSFAERLYRSLTGRAVPCREFAKLLNTALILYADHGFAASTFAVRTVASAHSDLVSGVVAGLGALKGWRHGGANSEVATELLVADDPRQRLDSLWTLKGRIPGFGHPVLRRPDERVAMLESCITKYAKSLQDHGKFVFIERASAVMQEVQNGKRWKRGKDPLYPNLEFPAAALFRAIDISDTSLYPIIFAVARTPGWCAHFLEQRMEKHMIRPMADYEESMVRD